MEISAQRQWMGQKLLQSQLKTSFALLISSFTIVTPLKMSSSPRKRFSVSPQSVGSHKVLALMLCRNW